MEPVHTKFQSIEQFRKIVTSINKKYRHEKLKPVLRFQGTVKLHGTHGDIVRKDDMTWCQSRNKVVTPGKQSDNYGFAAFMGERGLEVLFKQIKAPQGSTVMIAGEFCGGDIQDNVALSKLPKMFVIFG